MGEGDELEAQEEVAVALLEEDGVNHHLGYDRVNYHIFAKRKFLDFQLTIYVEFYYREEDVDDYPWVGADRLLPRYREVGLDEHYVSQQCEFVLKLQSISSKNAAKRGSEYDKLFEHRIFQIG